MDALESDIGPNQGKAMALMRFRMAYNADGGHERRRSAGPSVRRHGSRRSTPRK